MLNGSGQRRGGLLADTRGAVMVEYIVTVGVFALALGVAILNRGDMLLLDYSNARNLILVPAE